MSDDSDADLDSRKKSLEAELREVYEASVAARVDLERLRDCHAANGGLVHVARLRLERFEWLKARVMEQLELLEQHRDGAHRAADARGAIGGH